MDQPKIADFVYVEKRTDGWAIMARIKYGEPYQVTFVGEEEAKEIAECKCLMIQQAAISYGRQIAAYIAQTAMSRGIMNHETLRQATTRPRPRPCLLVHFLFDKPR